LPEGPDPLVGGRVVAPRGPAAEPAGGAPGAKRRDRAQGARDAPPAVRIATTTPGDTTASRSLAAADDTTASRSLAVADDTTASRSLATRGDTTASSSLATPRLHALLAFPLRLGPSPRRGPGQADPRGPRRRRPPGLHIVCRTLLHLPGPRVRRHRSGLRGVLSRSPRLAGHRQDRNEHHKPNNDLPDPHFFCFCSFFFLKIFFLSCFFFSFVFFPFFFSIDLFFSLFNLPFGARSFCLLARGGLGGSLRASFQASLAR
jgi:hypothetical protein